LIGAYVDNVCSDAHKRENQWQMMLSDAYDKKCKVLVAMGRYSSALHFGRLSVALDSGEFR